MEDERSELVEFVKLMRKRGIEISHYSPSKEEILRKYETRDLRRFELYEVFEVVLALKRLLDMVEQDHGFTLRPLF